MLESSTIDGLMQKRRDTSVSAMELRFFASSHRYVKLAIYEIYVDLHKRIGRPQQFQSVSNGDTAVMH